MIFATWGIPGRHERELLGPSGIMGRRFVVPGVTTEVPGTTGGLGGCTGAPEEARGGPKGGQRAPKGLQRGGVIPVVTRR